MGSFIIFQARTASARLAQDMGIDKLLVEACSELYKKDDDDAEEAIREFVERMRDQTDAGSENGDEGAQKK